MWQLDASAQAERALALEWTRFDVQLRAWLAWTRKDVRHATNQTAVSAGVPPRGRRARPRRQEREGRSRQPGLQRSIAARLGEALPAGSSRTRRWDHER